MCRFTERFFRRGEPPGAAASEQCDLNGWSEADIEAIKAWFASMDAD